MEADRKENQQPGAPNGLKLSRLERNYHLLLPSLSSKNHPMKKKINEFFCPTEKFDNVVLNHMLTLWLVCNALPWARVEDDALHAAFHYSEPSAQIYMRKWHAQLAQKLYLDLKTSMMTRLKVSFI